MEFILELILDIIIEGSLELGTSRKVPLPLRFLASIVFIAIYIGFIVLLFLIGLNVMHTNPLAGWFLLIVAVALGVGVIYAIRKKLRENNKA